MPIEYHAISPDDSEKASTLIQRVLHTFNAKDYTDEGITNLMDFTSANLLAELLSREKTIATGASDANATLLGICVIRNWSHLTLFFVDGAYHGQGLGRKIFELALGECRTKNPELQTMTVNSSLFALDFYKKMGFVAESETPEKHNGVVYIPMKLAL